VDASSSTPESSAQGPPVAWRLEASTIGLLGVAGLVVRLAVVTRTRVIFDDGPTFILLAQAMERGDFGSALAHPFHPLYSMLIWLTPGSAGHEEGVGIAWSVAAGTACIPLVWWLMRPLFGPRLALTAAALLVAHPYAVRGSSDVLSDMVYLAFFLLGLGGMHRAVTRGRAGVAFAAGIGCGLAYLPRPEGVGILVVAASLLVGDVAQGRRTPGRALGVATALTAGFAVLALPYMRVIQQLSGELRLTRKKSLAALMGLGEVEPVALAAGLGMAALAVAVGLGLLVRRRDALRLAWLREGRVGPVGLTALVLLAVALAWVASPAALLRFAALFASTLRPELLVLLVIGVGISASRPDAPSRRAFFFIVTAALYGAVTFGLLTTAGYLSRRHLLPVAVVLLGYAAVGLHALAGAIASRMPAQARAHGVVALTALCIVIALPKTLRDHRDEGVAAREAAEWVREAAETGDRIATERNRTAWYSGLVWVPIADHQGLRDGRALRRLGVRWIVAGEREVVDRGAPTLAIDPAPGQRFELVHEVERHGYRALVFEVHERGAPAAR
jgi:4-amino-4-deoxy-L-arabinose transferase-like glycosyltransferase